MGYQRRMYQAYRIKFTITPNGKGKEFLIFGDGEKDILLDSSNTHVGSVQTWIDDKYNNKYFNANKYSMQIFLACEANLDESVRPLFIANDIENYTKKKNFPSWVK